MKKIYMILSIILIVITPIYATRYFSYEFKDDVTIICPDCKWYVYCDSNSMKPAFECKDTLIVIEPNSRKDLGIGDIIWFNTKEGDTIHRIVNKDYKGCYITKGDNNNYEDDFTPCFYDIKFKVVGIIYE